MKQHTVILLLGSNSENRLNRLIEAQTHINTFTGTLISRSSYYRTAAWGKTDQPDFINVAVVLKTPLSPKILLQKLLGIERQMGRKRLEKWGPRSIDIDIIFYDHSIFKDPHLQIPHPEMANRRFVLAPIAEIKPHYRHPVTHQTVSILLALCPDLLAVEKIA